MADVFISYSRKDKAFVERLDEALREREREAWVDWEGIRPTEEFMQAIYHAIEGADTFIFILSPDSVDSEVCGKEVAHAVANNKRMVPIVAREVDAAAVPEALAKLNWIFFRESDDFGQATDTLIEALDTDLDWVSAHTRLLTRAVEWEAKGKNKSLMLRGDDLIEAESWLAGAAADKERQPTALQSDYIIASRKASARRQRIMLGVTSAVAVVLLVLAAAAVWFGINAERQRRLAMARLLAAQADARLDDSGDGLQTSLRLATESLRSAWTAEGYASWARAIALAPRRPLDWIDIGGASVVALDHQPDRSWLALVCGDGRIRIVDVRSKSVIHEFSLVERIEPATQWPGAIVKFSPDGAWLAAAASRALAVWDTSRWHRIDLGANTEGYFDLAFDRHSERLAAAGYGQPFQLFESGSWRKLPLPNSLATRKFRAVAFADTHLVTATRSGVISFWKFQRKRARPVEALQVDLRDAIHDIALKSDGTALALITERSGLHLWSTKAFEDALQRIDDAGGRKTPLRLKPQDLDERGNWKAQSPPYHLIEFSRHGDHLVTSRFRPNNVAVRLRETVSGRELARIQPGGPATFVKGVALAIGGINPSIWPLPERGSAASMVHPSEVLSVAFSPDRRWIAVGLECANVVVRQSETWAEEFRTTVDGPAEFVGFTPDSRWLIVRSAKGADKGLPSLHIFQTRTWHAAPSRKHEDRFTIYCSPDNNYLRTYTPHREDRYEGLKRASRTRIWEMSTAREVAWRTHEKDDRTMTGKVSIAEGTLPLGEKGELSMLEEAADWPELRPRSPHPGKINFVRGSADGRWLAGYGGSGAGQDLVLLEPATGRRLVTLREAARIPDVDFSPDGRWLASAEGTSVDIWLLGPTEALIKEACTRLARNFTAEEWANFMDGKPRATCNNLRLPGVSDVSKTSSESGLGQDKTGGIFDVAPAKIPHDDDSTAKDVDLEPKPVPSSPSPQLLDSKSTRSIKGKSSRNQSGSEMNHAFGSHSYKPALVPGHRL